MIVNPLPHDVRFVWSGKEFILKPGQELPQKESGLDDGAEEFILNQIPDLKITSDSEDSEKKGKK